MPNINLGSNPVTQDITIDEGRPFSISFKNVNGTFPIGVCAVMRIQYTADDPAIPSSIDAGEFAYPYGRSIQRIPKKNLIYTGAIRNIELKTTRPGGVVAPTSGPYVYVNFVNYSLLSLVNDTITLSYIKDMTTAKPKTVPSQPGASQNWYSPGKLKEWYIENFDIFSMPYKTAKYELYIVSPNDNIVVCKGNINKNALTIGTGLPTCV